MGHEIFSLPRPQGHCGAGIISALIAQSLAGRVLDKVQSAVKRSKARRGAQICFYGPQGLKSGAKIPTHCIFLPNLNPLGLCPPSRGAAQMPRPTRPIAAARPANGGHHGEN